MASFRRGSSRPRRQIVESVWRIVCDITSRVVVDREANEAVVKEVQPINSPARKAGIQIGDVVTRFDNRAIANAADLTSMIKTA